MPAEKPKPSDKSAARERQEEMALRLRRLYLRKKGGRLVR